MRNMIEGKDYLSPIIEILLFDNVDLIRTSNPNPGEEGDDIFDI